MRAPSEQHFGILAACVPLKDVGQGRGGVLVEEVKSGFGLLVLGGEFSDQVSKLHLNH